jgi:hypothetical protein
MAATTLESRAPACLQAAKAAELRNETSSAQHYRVAAEWLMAQARRVRRYEIMLFDELKVVELRLPRT